MEECKYEIKKTKMENLIDDELKASLSNDETDIVSDDVERESDDEKDNDEPDE